MFHVDDFPFILAFGVYLISGDRFHVLFSAPHDQRAMEVAQAIRRLPPVTDWEGNDLVWAFTLWGGDRELWDTT